MVDRTSVTATEQETEGNLVQGLGRALSFVVIALGLLLLLAFALLVGVGVVLGATPEFFILVILLLGGLVFLGVGLVGRRLLSQ